MNSSTSDDEDELQLFTNRIEFIASFWCILSFQFQKSARIWFFHYLHSLRFSTYWKDSFFTFFKFCDEWIFRSEIVIKGYEENENAGKLIVFLVILFVFLVVCLSILISIILNSYMLSKEIKMYRKHDKVCAFSIKILLLLV